MRFEPFELERLQSQWEHRVRFNLAESGVHPLQVDALIDSADLFDQFLNQYLAYNPTNGSEALRAQIARLYPGAGPENVLVTTGGAEANFLAVTSLCEKSAGAVVMMPNYMQIWGLLRGLGAEVRPWWLREAERWAPDPAELDTLVTKDTKLIAVCNPNNPTGAILSREIMERIGQAAGRVGAWILADEVYQGAERGGVVTPSFWGLYDKVIVTNGLSKAYGLPGLRVGWMVAPKEWVEVCWGQKDYTSISATVLSDHLARLALADEKRASILRRTHSILKTNYALLKAWLDGRGEDFQHVEPRAGAIAWVKYRHPISSTELALRLLHEKSLLIVPGRHFLMDGYLRIGYGLPPQEFKSAVSVLAEFFSENL